MITRNEIKVGTQIQWPDVSDTYTIIEVNEETFIAKNNNGPEQYTYAISGFVAFSISYVVAPAATKKIDEVGKEEISSKESLSDELERLEKRILEIKRLLQPVPTAYTLLEID